MSGDERIGSIDRSKRKCINQLLSYAVYHSSLRLHPVRVSLYCAATAFVRAENRFRVCVFAAADQSSDDEESVERTKYIFPADRVYNREWIDQYRNAYYEAQRQHQSNLQRRISQIRMNAAAPEQSITPPQSESESKPKSKPLESPNVKPCACRSVRSDRPSPRLRIHRPRGWSGKPTPPLPHIPTPRHNPNPIVAASQLHMTIPQPLITTHFQQITTEPNGAGRQQLTPPPPATGNAIPYPNPMGIGSARHPIETVRTPPPPPQTRAAPASAAAAARRDPLHWRRRPKPTSQPVAVVDPSKPPRAPHRWPGTMDERKYFGDYASENWVCTYARAALRLLCCLLSAVCCRTALTTGCWSFAALAQGWGWGKRLLSFCEMLPTCVLLRFVQAISTINITSPLYCNSLSYTVLHRLFFRCRAPVNSQL